MKKIIGIIIVIVVSVYFINSYIENKAKREAERERSERIEQATRLAVAEMATRTNAVEDWETLLSNGEEFRSEPVLTVELERLWMQQRPILFVGAIKDIATQDQSHYVVVVERGLFGGDNHFFSTELQLSLVSSKGKIDSSLKEHPELFKDNGVNNGVAVVARIDSIKTTNVPGENGEQEDVKIGNGELIEIIYTGDVQF